MTGMDESNIDPKNYQIVPHISMNREGTEMLGNHFQNSISANHNADASLAEVHSSLEID